MTVKEAQDRRGERRLMLRITEQERILIERAALLTSAGDVTRFVMSACLNAARKTIEDHEMTRVSDEMRQSLYELLQNPPAPSAALKKLARNAVPDGIELVED